MATSPLELAGLLGQLPDFVQRLDDLEQGGGGSGLTPEQVRDLVAAFLKPGSNVTLNHNDEADELTISAASGGGGGGGDMFKADNLSGLASNDAALANLGAGTGTGGGRALFKAVDAAAAIALLGVPGLISTAIANLVDSAPTTLNTLDELAAALGDDPNFATTIMTALGNRVRYDAAQTLTDAQKVQALANVGGLARKTVINTYTGSSTAVAADAEALVRMNVASANNYTLPPNSAVALAVGTRIDVQQIGAGKTTIVAGSGVTIDTPNKSIAALWGAVSAVKTATDTWTIIGATIA